MNSKVSIIDDTDIEDMADMFCGAGGTSTGVLEAAKKLGKKVRLLAINHWDVAISTHSENHPEMPHYNSDLINIDPLKVVPSGRLRLLVASPECTHFSRARGGKPMSKQSRASVKYVLSWMRALDIENAIIENVPEFMDWGPLHRKCNCSVHVDDKDAIHESRCHIGKPVRNRKGEYFHRFIAKLKEIGYNVQWRVLNAADYGDPTTRKRLFIVARKGKPVHFPEPTHHKNGGDMFGSRPRWRTAREIIDWNIKGESIFNRKKPLAENTLRRIWAGLLKYNGKAFVLGQQSGAAPRDVDQPIPTVASAGAISLIEPFIVQMDQGGKVCDIDSPMPTITSADAFALAEPFIVEYYGTGQSSSVDEPMKTITGRDRFGLVEPITLEREGKKYILDVLFRMLQPHELAAAMSFPKGYKFNGTREQVVKQIGNAVPVRLAEALATAVLS